MLRTIMQSGNLNLQEKDLCGCVLDLPMATTVAICRRLALCRPSSRFYSLIFNPRFLFLISDLSFPHPLSLIPFLHSISLLSNLQYSNPFRDFWVRIQSGGSLTARQRWMWRRRRRGSEAPLVMLAMEGFVVPEEVRF